MRAASSNDGSKGLGGTCQVCGGGSGIQRRSWHHADSAAASALRLRVTRERHLGPAPPLGGSGRPGQCVRKPLEGGGDSAGIPGGPGTRPELRSQGITGCRVSQNRRGNIAQCRKSLAGMSLLDARGPPGPPGAPWGSGRTGSLCALSHPRGPCSKACKAACACHRCRSVWGPACYLGARRQVPSRGRDRRPGGSNPMRKPTSPSKDSPLTRRHPSPWNCGGTAWLLHACACWLLLLRGLLHRSIVRPLNLSQPSPSPDALRAGHRGVAVFRAVGGLQCTHIRLGCPSHAVTCCWAANITAGAGLGGARGSLHSSLASTARRL
jgi:hypothetical protein